MKEGIGHSEDVIASATKDQLNCLKSHYKWLVTSCPLYTLIHFLNTHSYSFILIHICTYTQPMKWINQVLVVINSLLTLTLILRNTCVGDLSCNRIIASTQIITIFIDSNDNVWKRKMKEKKTPSSYLLLCWLYYHSTNK